jgi:hypothetical protein
MKTILTLLLSTITFLSYSQLKPIGSWTDHLPYQSGTSITVANNIVYCGTKTGLFSYNTEDGSISRFSKVNILNDVNIEMISYNTFNDVLIVVYQNANIDLIRGNTSINIPFIKDAEGITNKTINDITYHNDKTILSFGFGIVELNTNRNEISDTYQFGVNGAELEIQSSLIFEGKIYAATKSGLYIANLSSNLLDFNSWAKSNIRNDYNFKKLFLLDNNLYTITNNNINDIDSLFQLNNTQQTYVQGSTNETFKQLFVSNNQILYYATKDHILTYNSSFIETNSSIKSNNNLNGLIVSQHNNLMYLVDPFVPLNEFDGQNVTKTIRPNGPQDKQVFDIEASGGKIWVVPGGIDGAYNSTFNVGSIYSYSNGEWTNYSPGEFPSLNGSYDLASVKINPKDKDDVYFGSFGTGLYRFNGKTPFIKYDESNSSIEQRSDVVWDWTGVVGIDFDKDNNLWVTNTYNTNCLKARINNIWYSYGFSGAISSSTAVTDLVITESGQKWMVLPRDNAILVYDDNGTPLDPQDDRATKLSSEVGNGNIPGIVGINITLDKKDQIWVGTSDGIAVFFNPEDVFETGKRDAKRILIDGEENVEELLANTTITDITVDGANRKWVSTSESGVYLLSEDGTEEIHHFTTENSPLFSNTIQAIAVDNQTGEVFIGTADGIISYRGTATEGSEKFTDVSVFPNPVKESYRGPITISGLVNNSTIKITDISGALVNELRSIGGQAIWDGTNFNGTRAQTGVYLIFSSAEDEGEKLRTHIGKVLFIN